MSRGEYFRVTSLRLLTVQGMTKPNTNVRTKLNENDGSEDEFLNQMFDLANGSDDEEQAPKRRSVCDRCRRPMTVCWCPYLPHDRLDIKTTVYILQHPFEESRCLKTAPMLYYGLKEGTCHVHKGKRFNPKKNPDVTQMLQSANTLVLYPGPDATDINDIPTDENYNLVLLDGTWAQAKGLFCQNEIIQKPRKVQITNFEKSKYVIRTQPSDGFLSTLESGAVALSVLERRPEIVEILTRPLVALCKFQLDHGAAEHQSREFKIENGLWKKELSKSVKRRLERKKNHQEEGR